MTEQWVTMKVAAERLNIPANRISRWANRGLIQAKDNPFDRRSRLVNLVELQDKLTALNAIHGVSTDDDNED
jgi:DNA-binding MarR family transcriptional regulator